MVSNNQYGGILISFSLPKEQEKIFGKDMIHQEHNLFFDDDNQLHDVWFNTSLLSIEEMHEILNDYSLKNSFKIKNTIYLPQYKDSGYVLDDMKMKDQNFNLTKYLNSL